MHATARCLSIHTVEPYTCRTHAVYIPESSFDFDDHEAARRTHFVCIDCAKKYTSVACTAASSVKVHFGGDSFDAAEFYLRLQHAGCRAALQFRTHSYIIYMCIVSPSSALPGILYVQNAAYTTYIYITLPASLLSIYIPVSFVSRHAASTRFSVARSVCCLLLTLATFARWRIYVPLFGALA